MNHRLVWGLGGAAATVLVLALGWGLVHPAGAHPTSVVGRPAPELTVQVLGGGRLRLSELRGRPVVLNFWASWCGPCHEEQPVLDAAARRLQGRVSFVGVDLRDSTAAAQAYRRQEAVPYPVGSARIPAAYGVTGPPETFFIDSQGVVVARFVGPLDGPALNRYLQLVGIG